MTPDFERDTGLEALLRGAAQQPPVDEVDWARLRGVVSARAELPLAALRRGAAPAAHIAVPVAAPPRRTRAWLPLGAAGLAAAASLAWMVRGAPAPLPAEERRMVEAIVAESVPVPVDQMLSGAAAEGALLQAAVES
jgi:hypothetical protein